MEIFTILLFSAALIGCVAAQISVLYALVAGYLIFCAYALFKKHTAAQILKMSLARIRTIRNILIIFVLIGMLTALWRAAGTIPVLVCYATRFIRPSIFLVMTFLLNCLVSFLTGTSFGTAATMGVICMTMARAMGVSEFFTGGAILSGIFFGDRCSPVSTSALLIAELTGTDVFQNIRRMLRTAAVPFAVTCAVYLAAGFAAPQTAGQSVNMQSLFSESFRPGWAALIPALLILLLSLLKIDVKVTMLASVVAAAAICLLYQHMPLAQLPRLLVMGYHTADAQIASMLNGGGVRSMLNVAAIVCLSSSYAGIFAGTGLLDSLKARVAALGGRTSAFFVVFCVSVAAIIACNQTLTIMLTHQVCGTVEPDAQQFAVDLGDTAVVLAPLVPWSIAGAVPLASIGAPTVCLAAACYLYALPLWQLLVRSISAKKQAAHVLEK
ncbi:MAG: Na+/H+ antiporter NhaC family protein [Oscillospiraceae bacterium]|nr:Na+/H+ antiporter NhaC family protein [Oscillospiraceae bacterium]